MDNLENIARKITTILFAQQSLASAGFIAASTLNSIVGKELSQHANWAGVPTAVYLLAGAFSAFMWGYVYDAVGRRNGLTTGLSTGVIGSSLTFYSIAIHSFPLFLGGMVWEEEFQWGPEIYRGLVGGSSKQWLKATLS